MNFRMVQYKSNTSTRKLAFCYRIINSENIICGNFGYGGMDFNYTTDFLYER